ncbi:DUF6930 domain-containing protein [Lignipirellula cremea]|uniref:DUF6930 domain-containing protein n=1 Tax=Lignipirellula cremea TaxID=2528010 RepID=A0A518DPE5_9BACT|nr:hypothetical protein [Lignipirellula cremea]QDU93712.1 hypothetical protein Pla8534_14930 [Lignipirellula cremea]
MVDPGEQLKLGKGAAFVKSQLKRMRQKDETWEADFRALPKPIMQTATHYVGMVLSQPDGFLLAHSEISQSPTVNDLATLLAHAMKRPLVEGQHRPSRILLRKNPKWKSLLSALTDIGVQVDLVGELPIVDLEFNEFLAHMNEARSAGAIKPSKEQGKVEKTFPAIAQWVRGYGHIEIGDQEDFGFIARALDYGGLVFEDDKPRTLAESTAALEAALARWFENEGIEIEK